MNVALIIYKIEKGKGSEDACGYNIAKRIVEAEIGVTILTRENNAELLKADPAFKTANILGIDVPKALSFYKKKGRGIILYYYLWQVFVAKRLRKMVKLGARFDVVHMVNFHADWAPHFLTNDYGKVVWGPLVHHEKIPFSYLKGLSKRFHIKEQLLSIFKNIFWRFDPFLKRAIRRTDRIFYGNCNLAPPFEGLGEKVYCYPYAASPPEFFQEVRFDKDIFNVLTIGRLVPLKGFNISVRAFHQFLEIASYPENARMKIVGDGPLRGYLAHYVSKHNLGSYIELIPWVAYNEVPALYADASLMLYPSFESQGLVVAESMAAGVPVLCIEATGPAYVGGAQALIVKKQHAEKVIAALAMAMLGLYQDYMNSHKDYLMRATQVQRAYRDRLDWAVVDKILDEYRSELVAGPEC